MNSHPQALRTSFVTGRIFDSHVITPWTSQNHLQTSCPMLKLLSLLQDSFSPSQWAWPTMLLSHFSHVRLCVTPWTAAYQAPPSLGFSRQEHWSGLPFPAPMHESEKWKWSCSVMSDSQRPHGLQPTRLLHPCDFPGESTGVGCHCLLHTELHKWEASESTLPQINIITKSVIFLSPW